MLKLKSKFVERIPRSIFKVITWRIMVTITNFIGGWLASGNWKIGLGVAGFALVVNSILYFFHERVWNITDYGKKVNI